MAERNTNARPKIKPLHFAKASVNRVMSSSGTSKFYTGGRKPITIACRRWRLIWYVAKWR